MGWFGTLKVSVCLQVWSGERGAAATVDLWCMGEAHAKGDRLWGAVERAGASQAVSQAQGRVFPNFGRLRTRRLPTGDHLWGYGAWRAGSTALR